MHFVPRLVVKFSEIFNVSINSNKIFQLYYLNYIISIILFEQLAKDMHKLFALGSMGQYDVNGIEQFQ